MAEWFDKNIRKPIDLFSHPVWFVMRDEKVDCVCKAYDTKAVDPKCPICYGTGNKVKLARVKASHQNNKISLRGTGLGFSEINVVNVYYTHQKTDIKNGDIVVDGNDVDVVKDVYYEHSDQQKVVFYRIETVPHKNPKTFLESFRASIKGAGYNV